jgi:hypothetical protein
MRDQRGSVIVFVAIMLTVLIGFAALAVDIGNSRQQKREAQVASDAGALAGAYAINSQTLAVCSTDVSCTAAYYTFQSLGVRITGLGNWTTGNCGGSCTSYTIGGQSVQVTHPYPFDGNDGSDDVNVKTCWTKTNAFGVIFGIGTAQICGKATGERIGSAGGSTGTTPAPNCTGEPGENNFSDGNEHPTLIPGNLSDVKAGTEIGASFHGFDSNLDINSIVFKAPDSTGTLVTLPYDPTETHGYKLEPTPPTVGGVPQPYTGNQGYNVNIKYKIPNAPPLPKLDADGNRVVYTASLYAEDLDQNVVAGGHPDCGYAAFSFTWDGQGVSNGTCGENSFVNSVYPTGGIASPGDHIGAIYSDESPLQDSVWSATNTFGIKFTLSGPGFDDANGNPTQIAYTTSPATGTDKYSTKIDYQLPDASNFSPGAVYTASLTAYDTDQNKPGNDCGHATWSFKVPSGTAADIHLVE